MKAIGTVEPFDSKLTYFDLSQLLEKVFTTITNNQNTHCSHNVFFSHNLFLCKMEPSHKMLMKTFNRTLQRLQFCTISENISLMKIKNNGSYFALS